MKLTLAAADRLWSVIRNSLVARGKDGKIVRARFEIVGSVRRREPVAGDLDALAVVGDGSEVASIEMKGRRGVAMTSCTGAGRHFTCTLRVARRTRAPAKIVMDVFVAARSEEPYALFHYTGNRTYNIRTRALAKKLGWTLNQYGLFDAAGQRVVPAKSERAIARALGVTWREPHERVL